MIKWLNWLLCSNAKYNILTYVDFEVAFSKKCILGLINLLKKKKKKDEVVVISDNKNDNDEAIFIGKFPIHPRDRLRRFMKQEMKFYIVVIYSCFILVIISKTIFANKSVPHCQQHNALYCY